MGQRQDGTEPMTPAVAVMVLESPNASERMLAEAVATLAQLVDGAMPDGPYRDVTGADGNPMAWHFIGYRPGAAQLGKHSPSTLNAPEAPQYQGVVFADGSVAMRWLTARRSVSVWDTFADMFDVHGHPEYGTEIHWPNGAPTEARDVIERAAQDHRDRVAAEEADAITEANNRGDFLLPEGPITIGDPTLDNTGPELPGAVASSPNGWVVSSLADLTPEQTAELLATPGALRWNGTHFENVEPIGSEVQEALRRRRAADIAEQVADRNGKTLVVCLDCQGVETPGTTAGYQPLIVPFGEKREADDFVRAHRDNHPDDRTVTVPGWPTPSVAIGIAEAHAASGATS